MKKFLKFITWCFLSFITSIICTTIIAMLCFIVKKIGFVENINFKSTFFWVFVLPTHFLLYCFLSNYWDDIREKTPEIDDTDLNTYSNKDFWVARKNFNSEKQFCYDSSNPCPYCDTKFKHTSTNEYGEVYLSKINILLFVGVALLILGFKSSENLAAAYGISVTGAMLIDTILATFLLIFVRGWNKLIFIPIFLFLLIMDIAFFSSNLFKFFEGGWVPILIAFAIVLMMISWISGRERMLKARWDGSVKIKKFLSQIKKNPPKRVAGTAIFFVPNTEVVPMALLHNLKHNRILHKRIVFMHLSFTNFPKLGDDERVIVKRYSNNFYNIIVRHGFQEEPNIPRVLQKD